MTIKSKKTGKSQIRVFVDRVQLETLKTEAKQFGLSLEHYSGLVLSGFTLKKPEVQE